MEVNGAVRPHPHTPSLPTTLMLKQLTWLVHNSKQVFQKHTDYTKQSHFVPTYSSSGFS